MLLSHTAAPRALDPPISVAGGFRLRGSAAGRGLRALLGAAAILTLCACQSTPAVPGAPAPGPVDYTEHSPDALLRAAANTSGSAAAELYLAAAKAFAAQGAWAPAAQALQAISPSRAAALGNDYLLQSAATALELGQVSQAQAQLGAVDQPTPEELHRLLGLNARVCAAEADFVCAAERLIESEAVAAEDGAARQLRHDQIWRYLSAAPVGIGPARAQQHRGALAGWWGLKAASETGFTAAEQRQALLNWRAQYPSHPAQFPWPTAVGQILAPTWSARHVGLFLPLSGNLAGAGNAVRDGFIAAYLTGESDRRVSIWDTAAQSVADAYAQAQRSNVDLIIGPLAKAQVSELNALNPEIPTLALNYLPAGTPPTAGMLQLGLAIEDEADTLVERLKGDGLSRVLLLRNREDWAARATERIKAQWPYHLTEEAFENVKTLTEAVGRGMLVDTSTARNRALSRLLQQRLEHVPRARRDLDAVVALVNHTEATALRPALRYHFGDHLPIYASSQASRGATSEDLAALSAFRVSDLPWFIYDDPLARTVQREFALEGSPLSSLYALGADAFRISERFSVFRLTTDLNVLGATGILSVDANGRFHRELAWAVVRDGQLMPLPHVAN